MGFRSTFITEDFPILWPEWFVAKYKDSVFFGEANIGVLASRTEHKVEDHWRDLASDIQKAINWDCFEVHQFVLVFLHECGGVSRVAIRRDSIQLTEPEIWREEACPTHKYCYGCSEISPLGRVRVEVECKEAGHCFHFVEAADCLGEPGARRKEERCCRCLAPPAAQGPDPALEGNEVAIVGTP